MNKYFGKVIESKPKGIDKYIRLHREVWSCILKMISSCNLRNYSIFAKDNLLSAYFEYSRNDFDKDMAEISAHLENQRWCKVVKPLMSPIKFASADEFWQTCRRYFI